MKKQPASSATPCRTAERKELLRRATVPLATVAFCCGMSGTDALSAPCGPGRLLPVNTWLMTAPSCDPASPTDFVNQYGDDLSDGTYATDWISFKWDTAAQNYVQQAGTDSPVLGTGNWNYSTNASGTLFLDGTAPATEACSNYGSTTDLVGNCFAIDLTPSSGDSWQMVGNPFPYTVDWRNVRIASSSDGTTWTQRTPSQAAADNLMEKEFWQWNGSVYETKDDVTLGSIGALKPQESVWVRIKSGSGTLSAGNIKLLIPKRELNDTGITWSGNYASGNNATCVSSDTPNGDNVVTAQDCSHGPDVNGNTDTDGLAGFSFTKLDSNGDPLPQSAASWACVQDNVTGLIWEVKTDDNGLHDKDDTYTWYNTNSASNGGAAGVENASGNTCFDWASGAAATYCNTQAYVNRVNAAPGWCGATDWRMPTLKELESVVNFGDSVPAIDRGYFPNAINSYVWSGSPYAGSSDVAWYVNFNYGNSDYFGRDYDFAVRLVRGGQ